METIEETIRVYELLRKNKYRILIEDGTEFEFRFLPANYHHLAGYQHLTDLDISISDPINAGLFYSQIKNKVIKEEAIKHSSLYGQIVERIESFGYIPEILSGEEGQVIVEFADSLIKTKIKAVYYLYKREGTMLGGAVTYYSLFLGYDDVRKLYFPTTYIVEHSNLYINNQNIQNCIIQTIPLKSEKKIESSEQQKN